VIAGEAKGRRLKAPKGKRVRPTSDYLREALFGILGSSVRGVRFLDLYAGSGAVGIEALSRGGAEVVFLEQDPACLRVLRENVKTAGLRQNRVLAGDVLRVLPRLARQRESFDFIFHGVCALFIYIGNSDSSPFASQTKCDRSADSLPCPGNYGGSLFESFHLFDQSQSFADWSPILWVC